MRLPSSLQRLTILLAAATHDSLSSCSVSATKHYQSNNDITCSKIYEEVTTTSSATESPLAIARNLSIPLANSIHDAEFEHSTFWEEHGPLLHDAWREWEDNNMKLMMKNGSLTCNISKNYDDGDDNGILTTELFIAINNAFNNPNEITESIVKSLWMTTTTPTTTTNQPNLLPKGVYATQLLTFTGIKRLRYLLDMATLSNIPTRRPNGMNRNGIIIDPNVAGAVSMKSLITLIEDEIINSVVRPVGRMLFPNRVGCNDDVEYFAFTIRYDDGDNSSDDERSVPILLLPRDTELKEHRDASVVTMNVNLNLPEEDQYSGSEVFFRNFPSVSDDEATSVVDEDDNGGTVRFTPGMAIVHLGAHRHGSLPITTTTTLTGDNDDERSSAATRGKRYNLVIWLFGKDGDVRIAPYKLEEQMNVIQRWRGCNYTRDYQFEL
jgi:hypothetical protein